MRSAFALVAAISSSLIAQTPLARDAVDVLRATDRAVWFDIAGSVWVTDGTAAGTRDTGVARGTTSVVGAELIVYDAAAVHVITADGIATRLPAPPGGTTPALWTSTPTVWRSLYSLPDAEIIEIWRWHAPSWISSVRSALGKQQSGGIHHRVSRAGRYVVTYEEMLPNGAMVAHDLLSRSSRDVWYITNIDYTYPHRGTWSAGMYFHRRGLVFSQGISWIPDDGVGGDLLLPSDWGDRLFNVPEFTEGYPVAADAGGTEFVTFTLSDTRPFPRPPGEVLDLLWVDPGSGVLALSRASGVTTVRQLDRAVPSWTSLPGLGSPLSIHQLGEWSGQVVLRLERQQGTEVAIFDPTTGQSTPLLTGAHSVGDALEPFDGGLLFAADDGVHGQELWWSDGTPAGTRLLSDLAPGPGSSNPRHWMSLHGRVVFVTDGANGVDLWSMGGRDRRWRRNPWTGRRYRITEPLSWHEAQRQARNWGGQLATVRSQIESDWLWEEFGPANLWIGLHDHDGDGTWEWDSGEPVTHRNWCPGEPNRATPNETAAHIANFPGACLGGWNDQDPLDRYPALIERDALPEPVETFGSGCPQVPAGPAGRAWWDRGDPLPGSMVVLGFFLGSGPWVRATVLIGLDSTAAFSLPLPMDLGVVGRPDCELLVSPDVVLPLGQVQYHTPAYIPIPADRSLIGEVLFVQGFAADSSATSLVMSNGLRIWIRGS